MFKRILVLSTLALCTAPLAFATTSDRAEDIARTKKAAVLLKEIMSAPDGGIPHGTLSNAKCVAIIPGDKKFAFILHDARVPHVPRTWGHGFAGCQKPNPYLLNLSS